MFAPVIIEGHQHVDGAVVQDLPVETARGLDPEAVVLAVVTSKSSERIRQTNLLGLLTRVLQVSVGERTRVSEQAADVLVQAETAELPRLQFQAHLAEAVAAGRRAFDLNLAALERASYGPAGEEPAPGGALTLKAPEALKTRLEALAADCLPPGPRLRRHYLRLLRRIHAGGLAQRAELRFGPGGPVLEAEPYPQVRKLELQVPDTWRLPLQLVNSFALNVQVAPRLDWGYLGAGDPGRLRDGLQVRGLGLALMAEFGRWYGQLAVGQLSAQGSDRVERMQFSLLVGMHPFDLWREW